MSTSKSLIIFLFANCTAIEIFTAGVTLYSLILSKTTLIAPDFTPLTTLISAIVGEVIGYAIYSIKAAQENKQGGIVYEKAMQEGDKN
jgi:putative Mn2+ efflux pump MntP